jgi:MFS-type transporter involved in bile tolerance (Atg22 family)
MWMLARLTVIADSGARESRGREIMSMIGFEGIGRLCGPALGGFVAAGTDVRVPFFLHALFALIAIAPSFKLVGESLPGRPARGERRGEAAGANVPLAALLTVPIVMFFVAQFCASYARGALVSGGTHLYAAYQYDAGPAVLGMLATGTAVVAIPIMFSTGHLMDRFGRTVTAVPGFFLLSLALVLVAATDFAQLPFGVFVVSLIITQGSQSLTAGNMQVIGSIIAPEEARGRFFGVWRLIGEIGSTASPALFALLAELHSYSAGFLSLSLASLLAAGLLVTYVRAALGEREKSGTSNTSN